MSNIRKLWLVVNQASGSNDEASHEAIRAACGEAGIDLARVLRFPDDSPPTAAQLDEAGIGCVAVFAGDGTVNRLVTSLYGWGGGILILPGGTKNLLYYRLHGDRDLGATIAAAGSGSFSRRRPGIVRTPHGDALAGLMAGPGTQWNDVREALRNADIGGLAAGAAQAIDRSVSGPMVICADPALGRPEGYPLIMLTPEDRGFAVDAYHAETAQDFLAQGVALLKFDFRDGPHERLGEMRALVVRSAAGEPVTMLLDGEPVSCGPSVRFELAACEVDLLATEA